MPFQDDRESNRANLVPMPGMDQAERFSGPLPAGEKSTQQLPALSPGGGLVPSPGQFTSFAPSPTGQFPSPNLTRVLTTTLPRVSENTTSQRIPVVIKGSMKRPKTEQLAPAAHRKRRGIVTLLGLLILLMVTGLTLYTVSPLGREQGLSWNPLAQRPASVQNDPNNTQLQLKVQATATAVYHQQTDGQGVSGGGGGGQTIGNGAGSLNWPVGQCTYWANSRYHALTGHWVSWTGNANQWVTGARAAGWNVSTSPHVPSIIVLMGVQGANTYYGHVAVVESIVNSTTVHTSNMNWYANGGGWDTVSYWDFNTGSGVYFIWHK